MANIDLIRETSVFVLIGGAVFEYLAEKDETPGMTHTRVRRLMEDLLVRDERLFSHEAPTSPEDAMLLKTPSQALVRPPIPPVFTLMLIPPGMQIQVLPGITFKAFMREQRMNAAQQQGMRLFNG